MLFNKADGCPSARDLVSWIIEGIASLGRRIDMPVSNASLSHKCLGSIGARAGMISPACLPR